MVLLSIRFRAKVDNTNSRTVSITQLDGRFACCLHSDRQPNGTFKAKLRTFDVFNGNFEQTLDAAEKIARFLNYGRWAKRETHEILELLLKLGR